MTEVTGAAPVRPEDSFDAGAVASWLRRAVPDEVGLGGTPEVRQFVGGASNLTYLLRYAGGTSDSGRDVILRRPPGGTKAKGAHDMRREHDLQAALAPVFPLVPTMLALCEDTSVIGSEFYVMERVPGTILRKDLPEALGLDRGGVSRLCHNAVDTLVALHDVDLEASARGMLAEIER